MNRVCFFLFFTILFEFIYVPANSQEYEIANNGRIRMYIPNTAPEIRGVMTFFPGLGQDATWAAREGHLLTRICRYYDFAMTGGDKFYAYSKKNVDIFLSVIDSFAKISGHPELKYAPFTLHGGSMGGGTSYHINYYYPERAIAFFGARTHLPAPPEHKIEALGTPMIFNPGTSDDRFQGIEALTEELNQLGARTATLVSWGAIHSPRKNDGTYWIGYNFLLRILEQRYPFKWPQEIDGPLELLPVEKGWLTEDAGRDSMNIFYSKDNYPGNLSQSDISWLPDEDFTESFSAANAWKDPEMINPYLENSYRISGDGQVLMKNQGDTVLINVWDVIEDRTDSIFIFKGTELLVSAEADSISYIDTLVESGFHIYHAIFKDSEGRIRPSICQVIWSEGEPFNPEDRPSFEIYGNSTSYENYSEPLLLELMPFDTTKDISYELPDLECDFASIEFDSVQNTFTIHSIDNSYGKQNFLVRSIDNLSGKDYTRKFTLDIQPLVQKFEITPKVNYYAGFEVKKIFVKPVNPEIPAIYEIHKVPEYLEASFNQEEMSLTLSSKGCMPGNEYLVLGSLNPDFPVREYLDSIQIQVLNNIKFTRPITFNVNMAKTNPDTLWINPLSEVDLDVDYWIEENDYFNSVFFENDSLPAFLISAKQEVESFKTGIHARDNENSENEWTGSITFNVINEPLSTKNIKKDGFMVWPNPAGNSINILTEEVSGGSYRIFDSLGRLFLEGRIDYQPENLIDIHKLPDGIYTISIITDKKNRTARFIKQ